MRRIGQRRNSHRQCESRGCSRISGEQLVPRRAVRRNGQPSHEGAIWPHRHGDAVDLERCVTRPDASKNEIGVADGEHLVGLWVRHRDLQRTANIGNRWKLWIG